MASCSKQFTLTVDAGCWIVDKPPAWTVTPNITINGSGAANSGGVFQTLVNRVFNPVVLPTAPDYATFDGGSWGPTEDFVARSWHATASGVITRWGPANWLDLVNYYGPSDDGSIVAMEWTGAQYILRRYTAGVLMDSFGTLPGFDAQSIGPANHIHFAEDNGLNFDFYVRSPAGVTSAIGFTGSSGGNAVNTLGHAVLRARPVGAVNHCYHYNGVGTFLRYAPAAGVTRVGINASDLIVGLESNTTFFRWDSVNGLVMLGLPPGAATGSNIWVTDSGIIVALANNGGWYYNAGAWSDLVGLLPTGEGWTSVDNLYSVSHDGHAMGYGVKSGVAFTRFWCKLCTP